MNRILWVEDDANKLEGLVKPLVDSGYVVDTALSKVEAEEKLKSGAKYFLAIIDLIIPNGIVGDEGGDKLIGVELIKNIKDKISPELQIIVVSVVNDTAVISGLKKIIRVYLPKGALRPSALKKEVDNIYSEYNRNAKNLE